MEKDVIIALIALGGTALTALVTLVVAYINLKAKSKENKVQTETIHNLLSQLVSKQNHHSPGSEYKSLHEFEGDDLQLQKSRHSLAKSIVKVIKSNKLDKRELVNQLVITNHNEAWNYIIDRDNVDKHIEEAKELYEFLMSELIENDNGENDSDVAIALSIMQNNMIGRIKSLRNK